MALVATDDVGNFAKRKPIHERGSSEKKIVYSYNYNAPFHFKTISHQDIRTKKLVYCVEIQ